MEIPVTAAAFEAPPPEPKPLRVWTVFAVFAGTALAASVVQIPIVIAMVAMIIVQGGKPESVTELIGTPWGLMGLLLPAQFAILACWWLATTYGDARARAFRAIGRSSLPAAAYPCLALAGLGMLWPGGLLSEAVKPLTGEWGSPMTPTFFQSLTWPTGIAFVAFIALVPAFVEELFFRGYMQRRLLARWSPAAALGVTSLIFALFHGTPTWAAAVWPLGLWFGLLAWRTGSLWPGICCHAFVNGSVNLWRVLVAMDVLPEESPTSVYLGIGGLALASVVVSAWLLFGRRAAEMPAEPVAEAA